mgnify:CR=1 FL=1
MRRVRDRDTGPEMTVRRLFRSLGVGYRLGGCGLPGRPDLVMKGRRTAVFVHGCFWHGHDCARGAREPKANADYWRAKIGRNRARDARAEAALRASGWRVLVIWECELKAPDLAATLAAALASPAQAPGDGLMNRERNRV